MVESDEKARQSNREVSQRILYKTFLLNLQGKCTLTVSIIIIIIKRLIKEGEIFTSYISAFLSKKFFQKDYW